MYLCSVYIFPSDSVQSLDGQVSQLSVQLDTMGQVRLEFDEYKRKLEANSR